MAMQTHEFKAKSVDEAIEEGLATLSVTREAVDIEVVNKGSRGIFGIGSEPAVVRLTLRAAAPVVADSPPLAQPPASQSATGVAPSTMPERSEVVVPPATETRAVDTKVTQEGVITPDADNALADDELQHDEFVDDEFDDADVKSTEPHVSTLITSASEDELAAMAADMLHEMVYLMGFKAEVTASWQEEDTDDEDEDSADEDQDSAEEGAARRKRYLHLDVEGTDLGPLIGRRGETLDNMQYLLRLMINQKIHQWKNIVIDVERYKERRLNQLRQLAERMAEQVARTGRAISLEPMPANERRIVHMVLRDHPDVYTESYGDGPRRKVHIFARD